MNNIRLLKKKKQVNVGDYGCLEVVLIPQLLIGLSLYIEREANE